MDFTSPRFAHGVLYATAVLYVSLMATLVLSLQGLGGEERAFGSFVATVAGFVAVPVCLAATIVVYGAARLVLERVRVRGPWPYGAWGATAALVLAAVLLLSPPRQSFRDEWGMIIVVGAVGGVSGLGYWIGAVRGIGRRRTGSETAERSGRGRHDG